MLQPHPVPSLSSFAFGSFCFCFMLLFSSVLLFRHGICPGDVPASAAFPACFKLLLSP